MIRHRRGVVQQNGFTLIELLVAIAVIAILAAILFPVFARARENARRASCASNIRQISLGIMQYTQDFDETYPPFYTDLDGSGGYVAVAVVTASTDKGWAEIIQPYLKSRQIFQCPSEKTAPSSATSNDVGYSDYFLNSLVGGSGIGLLGQPTKGGVKMSAVASPSLTILVGDGGAFKSENQMGSWPYDALDPGQYRRHLGGNNFSFCDGHVKWFRPEKILSVTSPDGSPTLAIT